METFFLLTAVLTGVFSCDRGRVPSDRAGVTLSELRPILSFQGGDYFEGESYGGGSRGDSGARRTSVSFYGAFIFPENTESGELEWAGLGIDFPEWPYYWNNGIGFGVRGAYLVLPAIRAGGIAAYSFFTGKERVDRYQMGGNWYQDTFVMGTLHQIQLGLTADFQLPFGIPTEGWLKAGRGAVEGFAPYLGLELGTVYWLRAESTSYDGFLDEEFVYEDIAPYFRFFYGIHAGFEYRPRASWGVFLEFGYVVFTPPLRGKDLSQAETGIKFNWNSLNEVPLRGGVVAYF